MNLLVGTLFPRHNTNALGMHSTHSDGTTMNGPTEYESETMRGAAASACAYVGARGRTSERVAVEIFPDSHERLARVLSGYLH